MNAPDQDPRRPTRGTVVVMPPRGPRPSQSTAPAAPPGREHEACEEPGYGHGV